MAKVTTKNGIIKSLSGKLGNTVFRTLKSGKIIAYNPPAKRVSPLSKKEIDTRQNFSIIASEVAKRQRSGDKRPKKIIWQEVAKEAIQRQ